MTTRLILINGWSARACLWEPFLSDVDDFDVKVIDLDNNEELAQLESGLFEEPFVLLGWSLGAVYALKLAAQRPQHLQALLTFQMPLTSVFELERDKVSEQNAFIKLQRQIETGEGEKALKAFAFHICSDAREYKAFMSLIKHVDPIDSEILLRGLAQLKTSVVQSSHLAEVGVAQLHIFGGKDPIVPVAAIEQLRLPQEARTHVIPEMSHVPFLSYASSVKPLVASFLTQHATSGGLH